MTGRLRRVTALAVALAFGVVSAVACGAGPAGPGPSPTAPVTAGPTPPVAPVHPLPRAQPPAPSPAPGPTAPKPPPPPAPAPAPTVPAHLLGKDVERIPTSQRVVALTFDAGANPDAVHSILATLAAERVTATFFLTGDFVQRFPAESRAIVQAGHRLGNHSATHPHFTALSTSGIRAEVRDAEADIRDRAGGDPRPLFRFPYGDRDARTIATVNDLGYVAVRWTVDTLGWQGTSGGRSAGEVTRRVLDTAQPGQIVLMHVGSHPADGSMLDAEALPDVIQGLRAKGYGFVTLDALLG
jgi:peptidoglycan-N-acetylglucosamine deacetylase